MSNKLTSQRSSAGRAIRKFLVSGFVLTTYVAYALHERLASPAPDATAALPPTPDTSATQADPATAPVPPTAAPTTAPTQPLAAPAAGSKTAQGSTSALVSRPAATPRPTPTAIQALGPYKDGTYTGARANAFYGTVQVKVVIQNGRISAVQFLDYPKDRRTSARINSVATPWLQTEAIQAQSANVDVISGATLTSQAFMASLQSALDAARN
jgi:uncharacterized protein with FMN-binding domain